MRQWFDTGSTLPWAPQTLAKELGATASGRREFLLAGGRIAEYEITDDLVFEVDGEATPARAGMGEPDSPPTLGAVVLEMLGLEVDPTERKLKRRRAVFAL